MAESKASASHRSNPRDIARRLYDEGMACNCDLDRWQPEASTGHSCVCRIHAAAIVASVKINRSNKDKHNG